MHGGEGKGEVGVGAHEKPTRWAFGPTHPLLKQEETPASYR